MPILPPEKHFCLTRYQTSQRSGNEDIQRETMQISSSNEQFYSPPWFKSVKKRRLSNEMITTTTQRADFRSGTQILIESQSDKEEREWTEFRY
jgi:hypothetical protein